MPRKFAFVLEQTLGHVAHSRNIERALADEPDIDATVIKIDDHRRSNGLSTWPGLSSWSFQASWAARAALRERVRKGGLDAIFIHTQVASLLAADLMRSVPTVVSLDATPANFDAQGDAYGHRRQTRWIEAAKGGVNQMAMRAARTLVTWCEWAASSLVRDYGIPREKIHVIHPGVDLDRFQPGPSAAAGTPVRILFVGGNFQRKGGHDLLEALKCFDPQAVAVDIVTGDLVDAAAYPSCRVHYGLHPQSSQLIDLYRHADIFVLPTRGDCFPQAIAEAMACALPVIASDVGGIPEMVRHGVNGWLVSPADGRELRLALESLIFNAELRCRFGRVSHALAVAEHDSLRNIRTLFDLMGASAQPARQAVTA